MKYFLLVVFKFIFFKFRIGKIIFIGNVLDIVGCEMIFFAVVVFEGSIFICVLSCDGFLFFLVKICVFFVGILSTRCWEVGVFFRV